MAPLSKFLRCRSKMSELPFVESLRFAPCKKAVVRVHKKMFKNPQKVNQRVVSNFPSLFDIVGRKALPRKWLHFRLYLGLEVEQSLRTHRLNMERPSFGIFTNFKPNCRRMMRGGGERVKLLSTLQNSHVGSSLLILFATKSKVF